MSPALAGAPFATEPRGRRLSWLFLVVPSGCKEGAVGEVELGRGGRLGGSAEDAAGLRWSACSPAVTAGPHSAFALEPVFSLLEREA